MKTALHKKTRESGLTLAITLVTAAVIGIVLTGYLTMISNQHTTTVRSQVWNSAMPYAESGVEEAMTHVEKNWNASRSADGWRLRGGVYTKQRNVGDGYYVTTISSSSQPVITSQGFHKVPASSTYISRTVRVLTTNNAVFTHAMLAKHSIGLNGNKVKVDSFDSADTKSSTLGQYDPSKALSNGHVGSNSGDISVGNADIYGNVSTSPSGKVTVGGNGGVGDTAWHTAGGSGIQAEHYKNDLNVTIDDVTKPDTSLAISPLLGLSVNGVNYDTVLPSGIVKMNSLSGKVLITGDVTLYVSGDVLFTGQDVLRILPGATLKLYVAGANTTFTGNGILNEGGNALNFQYYGLPTNTSVKLAGNSSFVGTIYAPQADLKLMGGGNNPVDFIGALVSSTVTMSGSYNFHYDENLHRSGPSKGLVVYSWNEI